MRETGSTLKSKLLKKAALLQSAVKAAGSKPIVQKQEIQARGFGGSLESYGSIIVKIDDPFQIIDLDSNTEKNILDFITDGFIPVSSVVVRCVQFLNKWGLKEEGLYRISGSTSIVSIIKNWFINDPSMDLIERENLDLTPFLAGQAGFNEHGQSTFAAQQPGADQTADPSFSGRYLDCPVVASVLKAFIRELEPQIGERLDDPFYWGTLLFLINHLQTVGQNSAVNMMTQENLGIVWIVNLGITKEQFCEIYDGCANPSYLRWNADDIGGRYNGNVGSLSTISFSSRNNSKTNLDEFSRPESKSSLKIESSISSLNQQQQMLAQRQQEQIEAAGLGYAVKPPYTASQLSTVGYSAVDASNDSCVSSSNNATTLENSSTNMASIASTELANAIKRPVPQLPSEQESSQFASNSNNPSRAHQTEHSDSQLSMQSMDSNFGQRKMGTGTIRRMKNLPATPQDLASGSTVGQPSVPHSRETSTNAESQQPKKDTSIYPPSFPSNDTNVSATMQPINEDIHNPFSSSRPSNTTANDTAMSSSSSIYTVGGAGSSNQPQRMPPRRGSSFETGHAPAPGYGMNLSSSSNIKFASSSGLAVTSSSNNGNNANSKNLIPESEESSSAQNGSNSIERTTSVSRFGMPKASRLMGLVSGGRNGSPTVSPTQQPQQQQQQQPQYQQQQLPQSVVIDQNRRNGGSEFVSPSLSVTSTTSGNSILPNKRVSTLQIGQFATIGGSDSTFFDPEREFDLLKMRITNGGDGGIEEEDDTDAYQQTDSTLDTSLVSAYNEVGNNSNGGQSLNGIISLFGDDASATESAFKPSTQTYREPISVITDSSYTTTTLNNGTNFKSSVGQSSSDSPQSAFSATKGSSGSSNYASPSKASTTGVGKLFSGRTFKSKKAADQSSISSTVSSGPVSTTGNSPVNQADMNISPPVPTFNHMYAMQDYGGNFTHIFPQAAGVYSLSEAKRLEAEEAAALRRPPNLASHSQTELDASFEDLKKSQKLISQRSIDGINSSTTELSALKSHKGLTSSASQATLGSYSGTGHLDQGSSENLLETATLSSTPNDPHNPFNVPSSLQNRQNQHVQQPSGLGRAAFSAYDDSTDADFQESDTLGKNTSGIPAEQESFQQPIPGVISILDPVDPSAFNFDQMGITTRATKASNLN